MALAVGVVRLVSVLAVRRQLGLALTMVAVVAHVLCVVLLVAVRTHEDVGWIAKHKVFQRQSLQTWNDTIV